MLFSLKDLILLERYKEGCDEYVCKEYCDIITVRTQTWRQSVFWSLVPATTLSTIVPAI